MKKFLVLTICILLFVSTMGCSSTQLKEDANYEERSSLVKIEGRQALYYDENTNIVYLVFNECSWSGYRGYGYMSPYYAPNGYPYLYDVESNSLIEIGK